MACAHCNCLRWWAEKNPLRVETLFRQGFHSSNKVPTQKIGTKELGSVRNWCRLEYFLDAVPPSIGCCWFELGYCWYELGYCWFELRCCWFKLRYSRTTIGFVQPAPDAQVRMANIQARLFLPWCHTTNQDTRSLQLLREPLFSPLGAGSRHLHHSITQ